MRVNFVLCASYLALSANAFDILGDIGKLVAPVGEALHYDAGHWFHAARKDVETFVNSAALDKALEIRNFVEAAVGGVNALQNEVQKANGNASAMNDLQRGFAKVLEELNTLFPPPDHAPSHAERQAAVQTALTKIGAVLVSVLGPLSGDEEGVAKTWDTVIQPPLLSVVVLVGDFAEQHPYLLQAVLIMLLSGPMARISEGIFGMVLEAIGFGSEGVVKGSLAAWIQSCVFGPYIPKGSLFSLLQKVAMTA
ncbi:hypothetical protein MIND_00769500 [Mycena indigotica]|uniref:Uncharacterized protein n=1 Tax=Mycena indigotica TaxID=2126181 RepID=A0A8H6SMB9_9AGAR|nr:uncharacterized protein MIND_00769500 [Mycena indigotica]KAF7302031.1 hypothetical protein MIND_00769500 [Mycena indigotica]